MAWTAHKVVLRLCTPMHVGRGKVGNLQRTRPYVTGRNLWGALTARLTRDDHKHGRPSPQKYEPMGDRVHDELAFTYFYPTTDANGVVDPWPWDDGFRWRYLSTYASTALDYGTTSAKEASLHEVECLTPYTRDGAPVFLDGYILQKENSDLAWRPALRRLQMGGERGYGWGLVRLVDLDEDASSAGGVFGCDLDPDGTRPILTVPQDRRLLAHALAADFDRPDQAFSSDVVAGQVEPLVGRVTTPDKGFGRTFSQARICYAPGARTREALTIQIGPFGVWERAGEATEEKEP